MAKKSTTEQLRDKARYEYRVWGKHQAVRRQLTKLADDTTFERIKDCYLLVDDPQWNAKIRNNTLKVKQLVDERKGFEQWTSDRHHDVDGTPSPFDEVFEQLRLDRPVRGKKYDLPKELESLDPDLGVRAVLVVKERQRYRVGALKGEATDITIVETGDVLHTLSIEGDDLDELRALRKRLGLGDHDNIAVHHALGLELDDG